MEGSTNTFADDLQEALISFPCFNEEAFFINMNGDHSVGLSCKNLQQGKNDVTVAYAPNFDVKTTARYRVMDNDYGPHK